MTMTIDEIKRQAVRAARRGDLAKMDALEIAYMKLAVPLIEARDDDEDMRIAAQPVRLFRGAGPVGETRVQWVTTDGRHVLSDINGLLIPQPAEQTALFSLPEAA
jgi:hypothetical protein